VETMTRRLILLTMLFVFGFGFAVIQQPVNCSFVGGGVIAFPEKKIRTDKTEAESVTETVSVSLATGTYEIWLESYDEHDQTDATQPNEQWHVLFGNGQVSGTIRDLDDKEVQISEMVNSAFVLTDAISEVTAVHSFYPDKSSPNSVVPVCASFVRIDQPTVTPTTTDEPPTATIEPTATAIATGTLEPSATPAPTFTPQAVPTYCHPDNGCTPGGTG
jgi:hypothetical protein